MGSTESDIEMKAAAILAAAREYSGDRANRYGLMKQIDLLYLQLEDPVDALMRQCSFLEEYYNLPWMCWSRRGPLRNAKRRKYRSNWAWNPAARYHIVRLMGMLTGTGVTAPVGEDTHAHTPKSMAYLEGGAVDFFNLW
ncbi:hypothetical protein BJ875DRAFT_286176 [Amylocarpus encephaloides]|uniref:Uncharacterized protein n=1 Tax=Amylocarpus encephaloides TaxID=45428 RepID=A0A9P8CB69_9HELO|nr:hypothetical protein BJ875DRAFT_286176 [Amylocarpus encephaloides]